jgi:hypothetical protein
MLRTFIPSRETARVRRIAELAPRRQRDMTWVVISDCRLALFSCSSRTGQ